MAFTVDKKAFCVLEFAKTESIVTVPPVGFERTISAGERPHNYALGRAVTGTGDYVFFFS